MIDFLLDYKHSGGEEVKGIQGVLIRRVRASLISVFLSVSYRIDECPFSSGKTLKKSISQQSVQVLY